ncbi:hypothetical protein SKAU_G00153490 [Synaphobranchus kaupii]|uniref:ribonuclease H n=1 Tax=Synaphobranchus kaupii TaxID=118154 RepID=A0A9Q1FHF5_SYNKA|nr:hypothetical protein SKAU_G00153490 [Synaphobranchus kaupii]
MSLSGKPETKDGALSTDRQRVQGSPESSGFEERLKRSLLRTLMKLKKDEKLKLFQSHLSQYYPECSEREQGDPEALYIVEKMLETCGSERSLKITLHILRNMKQKDLTASLERDEQHNESIKRAQQALKTDLKRKFEFIFEGCLPGEHHIKIDPTVKPAVHAPRRIPAALRDRVIGELHRMEQMGVIVKQTEPTEWVNSMVTVVTPKKIRICVDPKDLNQAIQREHYPLLTVEEVVSRTPNAKYFSVLDANQGFWQIKLDDGSSKLCTMNAPIGRYRFLRIPFGVSSASEVFQRSMAQMIEGLDGVVDIIDDLLVWGDTEEEHDRRLVKLLERARENNLKLNKSKCRIRMTEIKYIHASGLKPDEEKVRAVVQLPPPEDKTTRENIGTDLFHHKGSEFLLCVDYFSKYPEIAKLSDTNSRGVITSIKSMFARHGIPDIVVSDNGPQYASTEFKAFTESWEFEHVTSSP